MDQHSTSPLRLVATVQVLLRWLIQWVTLVLRARQASLVLAQQERRETLRRIVLRGALAHQSPEEITVSVARAMYDLEMRNGAYDADVGLYGARLFRHEARAFLVQVLGER